MRKGWFIVLAISLLSATQLRPSAAQDGADWRPHLVEPGDTWAALAWRYGLDSAAVQAANPHPNRQQQPAIGSTLQVHTSPTGEQMGQLVASGRGSLLTLAAAEGTNPWQLARLNGLPHPFRPLLYQAIFIPGGDEPPREFPAGFRSLELSQVPARPGQGLAFRAEVTGDLTVIARLDRQLFVTKSNDGHLVGLVGTGAFQDTGDLPFTIQVEGRPLWSQPWHMVPGDWIYQQLTLTGDAAAIDAESIRLERERLVAIWNQATPVPQWDRRFREPIDSFLEYSSPYGARRSYNGGPYLSYHEGLDYSAHGGTPVLAPAAGTVVLAERLYVRGGAVILDHGLGVYSGFYHMSEVLAEVGQTVEPGQIVGKVGTTGLSTGNHLHWDMLVAGTWVDPAGWLASNTACWLLAGWGSPCLEAPSS
jgi:murein DD-endopeptidase MepM/ murein hydrolase activator NlpD